MEMPFHLGPRARRVLRYVGIAVLGLVTFVFALQMTFPYDRVKDKLADALSSNYDVTIGGIERGWMPGRIYFKALTLRTRQSKPDEAVTTFYIEKVEVDLGILALLGGKASVDLDAKIGAGHITGNLTIGKAGTSVAFKGSDLPGANLPLRAALGLPMTGKLEFDVALDLPNNKNKMGRMGPDWSKAEGYVDLACPSGCTLGDGHTKLKPLLQNSRNQVMVGDGIDFGKVNLDSLIAKAEIKNGKLDVTKFEVKSPDGELHIDYSMTLAPEFGESVVAGCLRFKASENLLKHEETKKTYAAITTTGAEVGTDGLFHIKLTDKFKMMKRLGNQECGPNAKNVTNGENFGQVVRPNLTVQPDPATAPPGPPSPVPPAPPPAVQMLGDAGVPAPPSVAPPPPGAPGGAAPAGAAPPGAPGSHTPDTGSGSAGSAAGSAGSAGSGSAEAPK